jgi:hypothetical protein
VLRSVRLSSSPSCGVVVSILEYCICLLNDFESEYDFKTKLFLRTENNRINQVNWSRQFKQSLNIIVAIAM